MLLYGLTTCRSLELTLNTVLAILTSLVTYPHNYISQARDTWLTTHRNAALW